MSAPAPRILIVDDDPLLRRMLIRGFRDAGYEVASASDGREALAIFPGFRPAVVLMDIIMPEREGVETTVALRALDAKIPIIAMSGGGRIGPEDFLVLAEALGATTSVKKPFTLSQILEVVRQALQPPATAAA